MSNHGQKDGGQCEIEKRFTSTQAVGISSSVREIGVFKVAAMRHVKEHEVEGERFERPYARIIKHLAAPWTLGTTKVWLGVSKIGPGSCSNPHGHDAAEEIFYVVSGHGKIRVGAEEEDVEPGSCVFVPIGEEHQLINTGDETLKVVAATAPPFQLDGFDAVHLKDG